MIKPIWIFCLLSVLAFLGCKTTKPGDKSSNHTTMTNIPIDWKEVDSLINKGLTKSASEKILEIADKSLEANDQVNWVKAVLRYNQVVANNEEDSGIRSLERLQDALKKAEQPAASILHTALAENYKSYLEQNLWQLGNRPELQTRPDSLAEWNVRHFIETINDHFQKSIEWNGLSTIPVADYAGILSGDNSTDTLRPTLYDVLVHHAIDYYLTGQSFLVDPVNSFSLTTKEAFGSADGFVKMNFEGSDSLSVALKGLQFLQNALRVRLADPIHREALIDLDLKRLQYVSTIYNGEDKELLYEQALVKLENTYKGNPEVASIMYARASHLFAQGNQWSPEGDDTFRWKIKDAYALAQKTIEDYPGSFGASRCQALVTSILQKDFSITVEDVVPSGQHYLGHIRAKNIGSLFFRLVRFDEPEPDFRRYQNQDGLIKKLLASPKLQEFEYKWEQPEDYQNHGTEFSLEPLPYGMYALIASGSDSFNVSSEPVSYAVFQVTDLAYWVINSPSVPEIYVTDRKTGQPVQNAAVDFIPYRYTNRNELENKVTHSATTDVNGRAVFPGKDESVRIIVRKGDDLIRDKNAYYSGRHEYTQTSRRTFLFLDRSIYRPGQRVYFKSYSIQFSEKGIPSILPDKSVNLTLKDANYQNVGNLNLRTNSLGTATGYFDLPASGLTGTFNIQTDEGSSIGFQVEEYKRPKFEITWDSIQEVVRLNEEVTVKLNAIMFAGPKVPDAKVVWRVQRSSIMPWYYRYWRIAPPGVGNVQLIAQGSGETNEAGEYEINFRTIPDNKDKHNLTYNYDVFATVTDGNGESHDASYQIQVNKQGYYVNVDLADQVKLRNLDKLSVSAKSTMGADVSVKGVVSISKLKPPLQYKRNRLWSQPDVISLTEKDFEDKLPFYFFPLKEDKEKWPVQMNMGDAQYSIMGKGAINISDKIKESGVYRLAWSWSDGKGEPIEFVQFLEVIDKGAKLPTPSILHPDLEIRSYKPGDVVYGALMTGLPVQPHILEIRERKNLPNTAWQLADGQDKKYFELDEDDRGGVFLTWIAVYNNRFVTERVTLPVPWTNKEAIVSLTTFRSVLEPGAKEKWTLQVKPVENQSSEEFEVLVSMYDKSLDQFIPHEWNLRLFNDKVSKAFVSMYTPAPVPSRWVNNAWYGQYYSVSERYYRRILYLENHYGIRYKRTGAVLNSAPAPSAMAEETPYVMDGISAQAEYKIPLVTEKEVIGSNEVSGSLRTALEETVFFFPQEKTDKNGNLTFEFLMKEGLTAWKFQALAHNKDLVSGYTSSIIQTQKKLMVFPNPPRFFRERDQIQFPVKVSSMVEAKQDAEVSLKIINAITNEDVSSLWGINGKNSVSLQPNGSASTSWMLSVPDGWIEPVKYQVYATTLNHTDGEEGWLPVVTNRILITETLPLPLKANEERTFVFASMQKEGQSRKPHSLTVEMTTSPAWYAVLALPYLMEYPYECAEQTFNRYYANALSKQIVTNQPEIQNVFEQWRRTNSDALISPLMKNQELKSAILEETPWVQEALSENQQRLNVGNLFEPNLVDQNLSSSLRKLKEMQNPSGGFSWFKGGNPNVYITTNILEGFGHLEKLGVKGDKSKIENITNQAVRFIDQEIIQWHRDLAKMVKDGKTTWEERHVGPAEVYYLYTRTFYKNIQLSKEGDEVKSYIKDQARKYWLDQNLYVQGLIALSLYREDPRDQVAHEILRSLFERSILHPELGRYWKSTNSYYWYDSGIERQSLFIELFQEMNQPQADVDEMRVWLLKQKQTQRWSSTKSTSAAVYAILIHPDAWLKSVGQVEVKIGKTPVFANSAPEGGTGYVKESWNAHEIQKDWSTIKAKNPNNHIAWGSAYYQYWEDIDKVERGDTDKALHVERSLWKVVQGQRGNEVVQVTEDNLKVGDKLTVRLTIKADRNMEFVHLKDVRGSGFEPTETLSTFKWNGGLGYYQNTRDLGTHFFIDYLRRGTYVLSYDVYVSQAGKYVSGLSTLQCMYAPEFSSHSAGSSVTVKSR